MGYHGEEILEISRITIIVEKLPCRRHWKKCDAFSELRNIYTSFSFLDAIVTVTRKTCSL